MKNKAKIIPIIVSLLLAFGVVTVAWIIQDATVDGIRIRTSDSGVELKVKKNESYAKLTKSLSLDADAELTPCVYDGNNFRDKDGNIVTDGQHILTQEIMVSATEQCQITATVTVGGELPAKVVMNGAEASGVVQLGSASTMPVTLQFYVDGNEYTQDGEATIEIVFHGEKL